VILANLFLLLMGFALLSRHFEKSRIPVGFGGSMIWFGTSAGVAVANLYPDAKSAGRWLLGGWHVTVAYVTGFFVMLAVLGWHPDPPHRKRVDQRSIQAWTAAAVQP